MTTAPEPDSSIQPGRLFVVATPIGNLKDLSSRALETLQSVACIAAEDTRRTQHLLSHFGVKTRLLPLHDHNESAATAALVQRLSRGDDLALVSDAGTPLVSDPGYRLVSAVIAAGFVAVPIPGPSALTAALSVAGLPVDQFVFAGFVPARDEARLRFIATLASETRTLVCFESVHRIQPTLQALAHALPDSRRISVHREITKQYESAYRGSARDLAAAAAAGDLVAKGEFVLVIEGAAAAEPDALSAASEKLLALLLAELPLKSAVRICQKATGQSRNALYERALALSRG